MSPEEIKRLQKVAQQAGIQQTSTVAPVNGARKKPAQGGVGGFLTSLISEGGAIGGGIKGAALGSALGPLGTLAGGAIGAGLGGFAGRLAENKIRDDEFRVGDAAKEGAVSAVFGAGPIRAGKAGVAALSAAKGGAKEAAEKSLMSPGLISRVIGKGKNVAQNIGDTATQKATSSFLKLTPAQAERLIASDLDPTDLGKLAANFGKDANEVLPKLQQTVKALESGIDKTASTAGNNIRISGDDIIKSLKTERKAIAKELGGGSRLKQMDKIIADAEKKYAKGVTVKQARTILKEANNKFGKSILDDSSDAVVTAAQKLEGNTMRTALRDRFPSIGTALDDEARHIQLREILTKTQAKDVVGGFKTGKLDITRPGTAVDSLLNSKKVSRGILNRSGKAEIPEVANQEIADAFALKPAGLAGRILASPDISSTTGFDPDQEQPAMDGMDSIEPTEADLLAEAPEEFDPYAPENLRESVRKITEQGGSMKDVSEFLSTAKILNELGAGSEQKPLNATQRKDKNNAESALKDIQGMRQSLSADASSSLKSNLPGGSLTQRITGTTDYAASRKNVVDAIARLRSGAAITEDEAKRYMALLPASFDTPDDASIKLDRLEELLYSFTYPDGGAEADLSSLGI